MVAFHLLIVKIPSVPRANDQTPLDPTFFRNLGLFLWNYPYILSSIPPKRYFLHHFWSSPLLQLWIYWFHLCLCSDPLFCGAISGYCCNHLGYLRTISWYWSFGCSPCRCLGRTWWSALQVLMTRFRWTVCNSCKYPWQIVGYWPTL